VIEVEKREALELRKRKLKLLIEMEEI
jgi:hypothetical protein